MRFGKSSSEGALFRSDVSRCWPVAFVYAAIWILALPLRLSREGGYNAETTLYYRSSAVLETMEAAAILAFFFGCAMTMALMSYLMSARATGLMHSLPITRRAQYYTHFAAGFGMFTAANLLIFVLSVLVTLGGPVPWAALGWWLLTTELMGLFFLSVGFLSAILTGWLLAIPAVYLILQFGVWAITMLLRALGSIFYWGYAAGPLPPAVEWLTPVVKLCAAVKDWEIYYDPISNANPDLMTEGRFIYTDALPTVLIYAAAGVLLLALGSLLYRIRRSEAAGDAVAHGALRPVVRAAGSLVGGLALGLVVYEILDGESRSMVTLYVVIMTALCYFALEMLLQKSFRIFARGWKGAAAICAVAAAVCVCVSLDLTGYQTRVPDAADVSAATEWISGNGRVENITEEETVRALTELHRAIAIQGEGSGNGLWQHFDVAYKMKNGAVMNRSYGVYVAEGSAVHRAANALLNCPEIQWKSVMGDRIAQGETPLFRGGYVIPLYGDSEYIQLSAKDAQTLFTAIASDIQAGRNAHDVLKEDGTYLQVSIELESADGQHDINIWARDVRLESTCTDTLRVLRQLGITEEELFVSDPVYYENERSIG